MRIYVATSWKNEFQDIVVRALRGMGHEVYDFKNPPNGLGFKWEQVCELPPEKWDNQLWREVLKKARSEEAFQSDMQALEECEACLLILPSGRSAHLELGYACAAGKHTAVLVPFDPERKPEPDLMVKMTTGGLLFGMWELTAWLNQVARDIDNLSDWPEVRTGKQK